MRGNVKLRMPAAERRVIIGSILIMEFPTLTERIVDADSPCHALFSLDIWEDFCGVLESYRALSHGVGDGEKVDESSWDTLLATLSASKSPSVHLQDDWSDLFPPMRNRVNGVQQ